ncbi:MAG: hypothetical protein MR380_09805 [Lachnospiraceae bacterium]|nr:hypothetical protein [Lachnospiraceae bacterium]
MMNYKIKMLVFFGVFSIVLSGYSCQASRKETISQTQYEVKKEESNNPNVLVLYEQGDRILEKLAKKIGKKTGADVCRIYSGKENLYDLSCYNLILLGGMEKEGNLSETVKTFLDKIDFQDSRLSPFWLAQSGENMDEYEAEFQGNTKNAILLPGLGLTREEADGEDREGLIDGWLTSAFTLKRERK